MSIPENRKKILKVKPDLNQINIKENNPEIIALGELWMKFLKELDTDKIFQFTSSNNTILPSDGSNTYTIPKLDPLTESDPIKLFKFTQDAGNILKIENLFNVLLENKEKIQDLQDLESMPVVYKGLQDDEFGISRMFADPLNNIHKLLETLSEPELINEDTYIISAEWINSQGNKVRIERRYKATCIEEAIKLRTNFIERLTGRQYKALLACWAIANVKGRSFRCRLVELMEYAHPERDRKTSFNTNQKFEFYQDLLDLSETKFIISKKIKSKTETLLLPFIQIHKTVKIQLNENSLKELKGLRNKLINNNVKKEYPTEISISVLHNPEYGKINLYNRGAPIKKRTLELRPDDNPLAGFIQIRRDQIKPTQKYETFKRRDLLKIAKLDRISHSGSANQKLIQKLHRLKERGIIIDYPTKITDNVKIRVRE